MTRRRIVVAIDTGPPGKAALRAAAELAARLQAELLALYVEDVDLLNLAALPFAREIGFPSAAHRELDVEAVERLLRLHAEEARRTVEEFAARTPLKWSFQVTRGEFAEELLAAAAEADLVVAALAGSERAARQLAECCRDSAAADFVSARTLRELDALLRNLRLRR